MDCQKCHQSNEPTGSFCIFCGSRLMASEVRGTSELTEMYKEEEMERIITPAAEPSETLEDLIHGQVVIMWARWILIATGLVLVLWQMESVAQLRVALFLLIALAIMNFLLYTEVFRRRGTIASLVYAASAADLIVITTIVIAGGGFQSHSFLFYCPAILAFSVAFPPRLTFTYTLVLMFTYLFICLASAAGEDSIAVIARLVVLAGVAVCGRIYWGVERRRRREMEPAVKS